MPTLPGSSLRVALLALLALAACSRSAVAVPEPEAAKGRCISERIRGREVAAALRPLDHPVLRPASSATHMLEGDPVVGVVVSGQARAYPWWIVKNHHVVNDAIRGTPVAIAFCEQCTGAAAFRRELNGRVLSIEVPGVYNGTIILRDRETRTLWAPFSGKALEGPLIGQRLDRIPLAFTRWDDWMQRHPETDVIWDSPESRAGHGSWYEPGKWGIVSGMGETIESWDARLPENTLVYGVEVSGSARSYPLSRIKAEGGVVNDEIAQTPVVVVARGVLEVAGYERHLEDRSLTFRPSPGPVGVMMDRETGSVWSVEGQAVSGPLQGKRLSGVDGYVVEWHVWSAYNPKADVFDEAAFDLSGMKDSAVFPALTLQRLDGERSEPVRLPGELNLVVLWTTWCPPCGVEMPRLQALAREHAAQGLSVVGIAVHIPEDFERDVIQSFVAQAKITFPIFLVDEASYDRLDSLSRDTGGVGLVLPTVFAADKQAKILAAFRGRDLESLPSAVERWLVSLARPR